MKYLSVFLVAVVVPILLNLITRASQKEKATCHTVTTPKVFAWLAAILTVCSFVCVIFILVMPNDGIALILLFAFAVLAILFWVMYFSVRIEYDQTGFCVRKLFRREKRYQYQDILSESPLMGNGCVLVMRTGRIRIDDIMVGGQDFLDYAEYQYRTLGLGIAIPDSKNVPFNGNVKDPWPIIIVTFVVGGAFTLCAGIITVLIVVEKAPFNEVADVLLAIWGITVLYWAGVLAGRHVLRNAQRYPTLAKLLIKKEFRNF